MVVVVLVVTVAGVVVVVVLDVVETELKETCYVPRQVVSELRGILTDGSGGSGGGGGGGDSHCCGC